MPTLLAVTVGGSCAPVVTAIQDYSPDYVCFIVSSGPKGSGTMIAGVSEPCGDRRQATCPKCGAAVPLGTPKGASIVAQTGLPADRYQVVDLNDPDGLTDAYHLIRAALTELMAGRANWKCIADYTGGTKTMSIALANAALELDWELSAVKGTRADLIQVLPGSEMAGLVNITDLRAQQRLAEGWRLFNDGAYEAAGQWLEGLLRAAALGNELQRSVREQVALCRAFDAWDRFDHGTALSLLRPYHAQLKPQFEFLLKLSGGDRRATGYESVVDLLLNAERRAMRGRYDDAVARLYRTLELFAQLRLRFRTPSLDASNVAVADLPAEHQARYEQKRGRNRKIALGLVDSYGLLADLNDPLSVVYLERRENLLAALDKRNYSILAHGLKPLSKSDYDSMMNQVRDLVEAGLAKLGVAVAQVQFPSLESRGIVQR